MISGSMEKVKSIGKSKSSHLNMMMMKVTMKMAFFRRICRDHMLMLMITRTLKYKGMNRKR